MAIVTVDVCQVDITTLRVDAIVNAANERMLGGGGVDGAIHDAAGPRLLDACRAVPEVRPGVRCPTGEARLTPGFDLPARFVIHTVGPIWRGGSRGESELLAACHAHCIRIAKERSLTSIAFPAISTGIYGYPLDLAARVAIDATRAALVDPASLERVVFACFGEATRETFQHVLDRPA